LGNKVGKVLRATVRIEFMKIKIKCYILLFMVLLVTVVVFISACGNSNNSPVAPASTPTPTPAYSFVTQLGSSAPATGGGNGQLNFPIGVAVDNSGDVYVADTNNNRVQVFTAGSYAYQWGSSAAVSGSGNGQFYYPEDIAMDTKILGDLYVADTDNERIQKFGAYGSYITQWGSYGTANGDFEIPAGVAVDGSGNVFIADDFNNRIDMFSSSGIYITQFGSGAPVSGSGPGQFREPNGIAVNNLGDFYVADSGNSRIQEITYNGAFVTQWGQGCSGVGYLCRPTGIAVDSSGFVYVTDQIENLVQKFTSNGTFVTTIGINADISGGGSGPGQFNTPHGIAVDSSGNVYVADSGNNRIEIFKQN